MDIDPAIIENPYHNEVMIDGDVKALSSLYALYDGIIACVEQEYEKEETMANHGIERPHLVLYIRPSCPYCTKLINYLKKEHKKIPTKDIGRDKNAATELIRIGGKRQVPCLVINGNALYESSDILNWLKAHKNQY